MSRIWKTWILFTSRSRQKCNIWHIFTSHAKERLLIVNVSIFTTFSVRKRLSNVKLLRQIYLVNKFTVNAVFAIFKKSIELVLNERQIQNLITCRKNQSRANEKYYALLDRYLVFLAQMSCKLMRSYTWHCCMSKHETLAKTVKVVTAFAIFARVENAKIIWHLLSEQNKQSRANVEIATYLLPHCL